MNSTWRVSRASAATSATGQGLASVDGLLTPVTTATGQLLTPVAGILAPLTAALGPLASAKPVRVNLGTDKSLPGNLVYTQLATISGHVSMDGRPLNGSERQTGDGERDGAGYHHVQSHGLPIIGRDQPLGKFQAWCQNGKVY